MLTCKEKLPDYAWPREIIMKDEFPYLASGKPDLKAMEREIEETLEKSISDIHAKGENI